jgi:hypothetical protein
MIKMRYVRDDYWDQPLYESEDTGILYVEVNGRLYYRSGDDWEEPVCPVNFEYKITHRKPLNPQKHIYMMLDMMRSRVKYFLGWGKGNRNELKEGSIEEHITEMKRLWDSLIEKPEWLTMEEIEDYHQQMRDYGR